MTDQRIRVLLVEDDIGFAESLREILVHDSASAFEVSLAQQFSQLKAQLKAQPPEVILLDLFLPDRQGLGTFAELKKLSPSIPVIILTGLDDETLAVEAVRAGAQDYLVKGQFDGRLLQRVIRYGIERKRVERTLRESEEFFRLISENVTDLIAVLDENGKRLYNSPSYRDLLGEPEKLRGTDSFEEVHPDDRGRVKRVFQETMATGVGQRLEYRFLLKDGTVRLVESQGSVIRDEAGRPSKLVVVARDITERTEAVQALRSALADVKKSHDELKATQLQLIQAERLQATSTFAAGIVHEVKNPLQAIVLGIDYLLAYLTTADKNVPDLLNKMSTAVQRVDSVIRGLMEFSAQRKREVKDEDLGAILEQSLQCIDHELKTQPIRLRTELAGGLPLLKLDAKTLRHIFISLLMGAIRAIPDGGTLTVRTYARRPTDTGAANEDAAPDAGAGRTRVVAEIESTSQSALDDQPEPDSVPVEKASAAEAESDLELELLRKVIRLDGGTIDCTRHQRAGSTYTVTFKT